MDFTTTVLLTWSHPVEGLGLRCEQKECLTNTTIVIVVVVLVTPSSPEWRARNSIVGSPEFIWISFGPTVICLQYFRRIFSCTQSHSHQFFPTKRTLSPFVVEVGILGGFEIRSDYQRYVIWCQNRLRTPLAYSRILADDSTFVSCCVYWIGRLSPTAPIISSKWEPEIIAVILQLSPSSMANTRKTTEGESTFSTVTRFVILVP